MPRIIDQLTEKDRQAIVAMAREQLGDSELEFDDGAQVNFTPLTEGGDNGAFIQAWIWFSFTDTPWDQDAEDWDRPVSNEKTEALIQLARLYGIEPFVPSEDANLPPGARAVHPDLAEIVQQREDDIAEHKSYYAAQLEPEQPEDDDFE